MITKVTSSSGSGRKASRSCRSRRPISRAGRCLLARSTSSSRPGKIGPALGVLVVGEAVAEQRQDVAAPHEVDLVDRVRLLDAEQRHRLLVARRGGHGADLGKDGQAVAADRDQAVEGVGEHHRQRVGRRQEAERAVLHDLAVDQGQGLVDARGVVEARIQGLEEVGGDLAEEAQLVVHAQQEGLVEDGGEEGRAVVVALDVDDGDAGAGGGGAELVLQRVGRFADELVHLVALLEVDVDEVVAARLAVARQDLAVDVDPGDFRDLARRRVEVAQQLFQPLQLLPRLSCHRGLRTGSRPCRGRSASRCPSSWRRWRGCRRRARN